jgi:hypothetical protein
MWGGGSCDEKSSVNFLSRPPGGRNLSLWKQYQMFHLAKFTQNEYSRQRCGIGKGILSEKGRENRDYEN